MATYAKELNPSNCVRALRKKFTMFVMGNHGVIVIVMVMANHGVIVIVMLME